LPYFRFWTARSGDKCHNYEATAPPTFKPPGGFINVFGRGVGGGGRRGGITGFHGQAKVLEVTTSLEELSSGRPNQFNEIPAHPLMKYLKPLF